MGFSLTGFLIAVVLVFPNTLAALFPPQKMPKGLRRHESNLITALEKTGQAGCLLALIIAKSGFDHMTVNVWSVLMGICIAIYYGLWIRYVLTGYRFASLFQPWAGIPVPMAVFPVLALGFASVIGQSVFLAAATVLLAAGHIVNSWRTYRQINSR